MRSLISHSDQLVRSSRQINDLLPPIQSAILFSIPASLSPLFLIWRHPSSSRFPLTTTAHTHTSFSCLLPVCKPHFYFLVTFPRLSSHLVIQILHLLPFSLCSHLSLPLSPTISTILSSTTVLAPTICSLISVSLSPCLS